MISLQRSMHSSQMYTPGPAMSFFTCFWLLPQKEHLSRSPPSPMRATRGSPSLGQREGRRWSRTDRPYPDAAHSGSPFRGRVGPVRSERKRWPEAERSGACAERKRWPEAERSGASAGRRGVAARARMGSDAGADLPGRDDLVDDAVAERVL